MGLTMLEAVPDLDSVTYIDEYPHLQEKVRLRRLGQQTLFRADWNQLIIFPIEGEDGGEFRD